MDIVEADTLNLDLPAIKMDFPLTSILKCEGHLWVCIGEVIDITFDAKSANRLSVDLLSEPSSFVQFQLLDLIPATIEDDPNLKNDWHWSTK